MKILLAGPGTGKTTSIKSIIDTDFPDASRILVLSFTNATVNDLKKSFKDYDNVYCYTLHSYALKINHLPYLHILNQEEKGAIEAHATKLDLSFSDVCYFLNCITFDDMIDRCIKFMKSNPEYASNNIGHFDILIVDEFQDFNEAERSLVDLVKDFAEETFILGDDDQSIYGFKDADPDAIIEVYKDAKDRQIPHENICYRCPDQVVDYCSKFIKENKNRISKPWIKSGKEGDIVHRQFMTQQNTFDYICNMIKTIPEEESILILSPVHFYVPQLIATFDIHGIQYIDFWDKKLQTDLSEQIWWLKTIYGNHNLTYLLCLGKSLKLLQKAKYISTLKNAFQTDFDEQATISALSGLGFPEPLATYAIQPLPFNEFLQKHPQFELIAENVDQDNLARSIDELDRNMAPPLEFSKDMVNIMSIHKSKGLQANHVFITGLVEGVLPNKTSGIDTIEAQRRLLFVGMTRALNSLHLISTIEWDGKFVHRVDKDQFQYQYKKKYHGKTSRFIEEIVI